MGEKLKFLAQRSDLANFFSQIKLSEKTTFSIGDVADYVLHIPLVDLHLIFEISRVRT